MADRVSVEQRSANMRMIKSHGMKPELAVRKMLHALGYRFRLHRKDLPGTPDIVFAGRKKAIFVHGCFWHQHDAATCKLVHKPRSNTSYWDAKLARNVARDATATKALRDLGWEVLTIWECEASDASLAKRLVKFLDHSSAGSPS